MSRPKYDKIIKKTQGQDVSKLVEPIPIPFAPKNTDYRKGFVFRYMCIHRTNKTIIEIDHKQTKAFDDKKTGPNQHLWKAFKVRWKLRGPERDLIQNGVVIKRGIVDVNKKVIDDQAKIIPEVHRYFTDMKRFGRIDDKIPTLTYGRHYGSTGEPIPPILPLAYKRSQHINQVCKNCGFLGKRYYNTPNNAHCHKWNASIKRNYWCKSWKPMGEDHDHDPMPTQDPSTTTGTTTTYTTTPSTTTTTTTTTTGTGGSGGGGGGGGGGGY